MSSRKAAGVGTTIRPLRSDDLAAVTAALPGLPFAPSNKHAERLALQGRGCATYLIAWLGSEPAGHVLVHHEPRSEQGVALGCAELEDLLVREGRRGRGVGGALVAAAESTAGDAGAGALGLAVTVTNPSNAAARRLYDRCGYADADLAEFVLGYTYWDELGRPHRDEELYRYLVKRLSRS